VLEPIRAKRMGGRRMGIQFGVSLLNSGSLNLHRSKIELMASGE